MSFSVIIPSKTINNLRACIACIRAARETRRIILVRDGPIVGEDFIATDGGNSYLSGLGPLEIVKGVQPFVFARNINLGIGVAGEDDVVLLNDDACLTTPYGFSYLAAIAKDHPEYGIISAGITAAVGNEEQLAQPGTRLREAKHHTLVFVCVYIRREVLDCLLPPLLTPSIRQTLNWAQGKPESYLPRGDEWLDERFVNYGYDDDDMCERVRQLGLKLGVFDGCVVEHGVLLSTYRGSGSASLMDLKPNRDRFIEKWGFSPGQGPSMRKAKVGFAPGVIKW